MNLSQPPFRIHETGLFRKPPAEVRPTDFRPTGHDFVGVSAVRSPAVLAGTACSAEVGDHLYRREPQNVEVPSGLRHWKFIIRQSAVPADAGLDPLVV
jgi:hypothetical protein